MGEVYLAEHILLRRPCAVKLIAAENADDEKQIARFEREVKATAALTHPNTVEIYDYGRTEDGTFYYAMEYLSGLDLNELVERFGPLPPGRAIHLLEQVCGALSEAHQRGMVHRDVKPANIIVCMRGGIHDTVKLLDFGLARVVAEESDSGRLTQDGAITGTPEFMSPEQAESEGDIDSRCDIYSVGAVAYFLLTGRPPFERKSATGYIIAHAREQPAKIGDIHSGIPEPLADLVMKCLEKKRDDRFQSVEALRVALTDSIPVAGVWSASDARDWWQHHAIAEVG
jgi:serine/threonine-protein kinase